jgi:hypothetical protein
MSFSDQLNSSRRTWQVLVWGSALAAGDHPDSVYHFQSQQEAEKKAAEKLAEGWEASSVEVVAVDPPPEKQGRSIPLFPNLKVGPRGGVYTDDVTKDGRPYRRYC